MSRVIINGTLAPIPKPVEIDFDPVRGLVMTLEYHSAGDNLAGLANVYRAANIAYKWRRGPVMSTLVATVSGGQGGLPDTPQPNWQVLGNEIQKSIFESAIAQSGLESFPNLIRDVKDGFAAIESGDLGAEADLRDFLPAEELQYYDYLITKLLNGQTHFAAGQYVLKGTISVSNFYAMPLNGEGNTGLLLSMSAILSFGLPPVMAAKLSSIPIPVAHPGYAWGWRQLPTQMTTGAQNRVEVSTEWWWDEWDTTLYPLA